MNEYFSKAKDHAKQAERIIAKADPRNEAWTLLALEATHAQVHATLAVAYAQLATGRGG